MFSKFLFPFKFGIKAIKYWIDNNFRKKVVPIKGSVLYCDLYAGAEHSGIYVGDEQISNIVVDGFAESIVELSYPDDFTSKSILHKHIYVSSDKYGSVGDEDVSKGATNHIGERKFYGLMYSNCHTFSKKCVNYSKQNHYFLLSEINESWEPTLSDLKRTAKKKLGATKWYLWDRNKNSQNGDGNKGKEPNMQDIQDYFENLKLNQESMQEIEKQLQTGKDYLEEIKDENLPSKAFRNVQKFNDMLENIKNEYNKIKEFSKLVGQDFSIKELHQMNDDFYALVKQIKNNQKIKDLIKKLGRDYITEYQKSHPKICKRLNTETFGIHKSNDLIRILPSELMNLDDEDLEYLFYSKLLENNLLTYELVGYTTEEITEKKKSRKGPVVALLDTSGSMNGLPLLKAKALLYSTLSILEKENRSLYVVLFGSIGQTKEININNQNGLVKLSKFLNQGFGGGTDFETPISRAIQIIKDKKDYEKADILMITDGLCSLTNHFIENLKAEKEKLDFSIYTILCAGSADKDSFSDEVVVLQKNCKNIRTNLPIFLFKTFGM
jgi:uncharacterized protein with von Willebrand factor type A (vWA) domain